MKVGLLDNDQVKECQIIPLKPFPNLALMKFSTYYKSLGYYVEIYNRHKKYDLVIVSKVFDDSITNQYPHYIKAKKVIYGGYGNGINKVNFIEAFDRLTPDYSLYSIEDRAVGFLTRGCPRNCDFCIVSKIEGCKAYQVAYLKDF